MGKGDWRRPTRIPDDEFDRRWGRTFGSDDSRTDNEKCPQNVTPDPDINPAEWEDKQDE